MDLLVSKPVYYIENSNLYKCSRFLFIPIGAVLWLLFLRADTGLGTGTRIIALHLVTLAVLFLFLRLWRWFLGAFKKDIRIASFDGSTLSLRLDVKGDYDVSMIERVEYSVPGVFRSWNWPLVRSRITLHYNDNVIELKTKFELSELQDFFHQVNSSIREIKELEK